VKKGSEKGDEYIFSFKNEKGDKCCAGQPLGRQDPSLTRLRPRTRDVSATAAPWHQATPLRRRLIDAELGGLGAGVGDGEKQAVGERNAKGAEYILLWLSL
jgi:hypothetical protein